jgi:hypothetical protein
VDFKARYHTSGILDHDLGKRSQFIVGGDWLIGEGEVVVEENQGWKVFLVGVAFTTFSEGFIASSGHFTLPLPIEQLLWRISSIVITSRWFFA